MKFLVLFLIGVTVASCYQQNPVFKNLKNNGQAYILKYLNDCVTESEVDPVLAVRLMPHGEFPSDDRNVKCFVKCIARKLDMVNEDGTAKPENFMKVLNLKNPNVADEGHLQSCFTIKLSDPCDTAFKIIECMHIGVGKAVDILHPVQ